MPLPLSALIIAVPTFFYARLVRGVDRFETEPVKYLIAAFLWGAIPAAFFALIAQLVLAIPTSAAIGESGMEAVATAIYAPITEEIAKGLAVAIVYLLRRREFDGWIDGIVYGSTVGFGFAYVENVLYLADTESLGDWIGLFVLRVLVLGFMHGFWTSLTGIGFGLARHAPSNGRKLAYILGGLMLAILAHAVHNASIVLADVTGAATLCGGLLNYAVLIALMFGLRRVGARHERQLFRSYMVDEVPAVITPEAYSALWDAKSNSESLPQPRATFYQLAGELAQRKQQILRGEASASADVDRLREQLRRMSYPDVVTGNS
jgi:RsiW-degrading membrane proteinase PrsW (M82 family)